jgi:rod shape-determining protein MreB and related proteins
MDEMIRLKTGANRARWQGATNSAASGPVAQPLFIDIGGGTTDFCLVQGYFPAADEQVSLTFAGDHLDARLHAAIRKTYPDCELTPFTIRDLKEQHSFVGSPSAPVVVSVMVGGKVRKLDIPSSSATRVTNCWTRS